jgi:threonine dehydratase
VITFEDVCAAHARIAPHVHRTPVMTSRSLDERAGTHLHLKCENFQRSGAFKARGAFNAVLQVPEAEASRGVAAHSSGNHGGALALAARECGIPCYVVMPAGAPRAKVDAVRGYGGHVVECAPTMDAREAKLAEVLAETGAHEVHPYDDPRVIAGAGTAAMELLEQHPDLDLVIAPVSGGGLLSGTAIAAHGMKPLCRIWGAEPAGADDAYRSLERKKLEPRTEGSTIADGLLAALSARTFGILSEHVEGIVRVEDGEILDAMRALFERCKLVVEPSGAAALAGVFAHPEVLPERVGVILSGGNLDFGTYDEFEVARPVPHVEKASTTDDEDD